MGLFCISLSEDLSRRWNCKNKSFRLATETEQMLFFIVISRWSADRWYGQVRLTSQWRQCHQSRARLQVFFCDNMSNYRTPTLWVFLQIRAVRDDKTCSRSNFTYPATSWYVDVSCFVRVSCYVCIRHRPGIDGSTRLRPTPKVFDWLVDASHFFDIGDFVKIVYGRCPEPTILCAYPKRKGSLPSWQHFAYAVHWLSLLSLCLK